MSKDWYSVKQVARILDKSANAIYAMLDAGKLGHYRAGSSYRIRKEHLQAYFARQGVSLEEMLAAADEQAEALDEAASELAAAAAQPAPAAPKAGTPAASAAGRAAGGKWQPLRAASAAPTPRSAASALGEKGGRAARQREADYLARVRALFHSGVGVAHPESGEMIRLANWASVEQMEDDLRLLGEYLQLAVLRPMQQAAYPHNARVLYWIKPHSLGGSLRTFPAQGLVIECAVLSRLDRYVRDGHDTEKLGLADLLPALAERQSLAQTLSPHAETPTAYIVALASTTGWDAASIAYVRQLEGTHQLEDVHQLESMHQLESAHLIVYLVDLIDPRICAASAHPKSAQYRDLFDLPPEE